MKYLVLLVFFVVAGCSNGDAETAALKAQLKVLQDQAAAAQKSDEAAKKAAEKEKAEKEADRATLASELAAAEAANALCRDDVIKRRNEHLIMNGKPVPGREGEYRHSTSVGEQLAAISRDGNAACDSAYALAVQKIRAMHGVKE